METRQMNSSKKSKPEMFFVSENILKMTISTGF